MTQSSSTPSTIAIETPREHVLQITICRPKALNALNAETVSEIGAALLDAEANPDVRCVVLTGDERAFCAGADIKQMLADGAAALKREDRVRGWKAIESFRKPIVAAVEGLCLGGGNELAMTTDIIVAGEGAAFGQPEVKIGILPGDGGTQRLVRAVGKSLAMKMILSGEFIDAHTALAAGLAAEVVPQGGALARSLDLAAAIAANAPRSVEMAKAAVNAAQSTSLDVGLYLERQAVYLAFATDDLKEGMSAFVDKRPPRFRGV